MEPRATPVDHAVTSEADYIDGGFDMDMTRRGLGIIVLASSLALVAGPAGAGDLQSWDKVMPNANQRFKVLNSFNGEAVLDNETQLVWEQTTDKTSRPWAQAQRHCYGKAVGGRMGWRPPTIEELTSLIDPSEERPVAKLPPGHPFDAGTTNYWSSTTAPDDPTAAWFLRLASGDANTGLKTEDDSVLAWCVRGGHGHDAY